MAGGVIELADRIWRGEVSIDDHHPVQMRQGSMEPVADGIMFLHGLGNGVAVDTPGDELFMVDGNRGVQTHIRAWSSKRLGTAVYSHGHVDHVFGTGLFDEEAAEKGWPAPVVVAHEALPARFDRYILTAGYNGVINQRQFQLPAAFWPTEYRYPDRVYRDRLDLEVGGLRIELHHAKGETDDHTWTWVPERKLLCSGDLFIWAVPNGGNPQKVQRYPREWEAALREMIALEPEYLLPGHGYPVIGAQRVRQALTDTADLLASLVSQTLDMMNAGASLDEIIHTVTVPEELARKPYLQPVYDEPEFIVRNLWRLYGGWYDGTPSRLKPAPDAAVAREIAGMAGGAGALADRARELSESGDDRLACHLADMAATAEPASRTVQEARAEVYERRVERERSTMAKGIYAFAARASREAAANPSQG